MKYIVITIDQGIRSELDAGSKRPALRSAFDFASALASLQTLSADTARDELPSALQSFASRKDPEDEVEALKLYEIVGYFCGPKKCYRATIFITQAKVADCVDVRVRVYKKGEKGYHARFFARYDDDGLTIACYFTDDISV